MEIVLLHIPDLILEVRISFIDLCGLCLDAGVLRGGEGFKLLQTKVKVRVDVGNVRAKESLNHK